MSAFFFSQSSETGGQHCVRQVAACLLHLVLFTSIHAQSAKSDWPSEQSVKLPHLAVINNWLQDEVADSRRAQALNRNSLDACVVLLDKARNDRNSAAVAAAQIAVNTADAVLRKNQLREQRALKAISWVARLSQESDSSTKVAALIPRIEGIAEILSPSGGTPHRVTGDMPPVLKPGDTLRTAKNGYADVLLDEGGLLSLDSGSALVLAEKGAQALLYGEIFCKVRRRFEVRTPSAAIAVRGTQFVLREVPGKPASVVVIDGMVAFSGIKGETTVLVGAGQQSYLLPDGTPAEPAKANLQEMKKWWED